MKKNNFTLWMRIPLIALIFVLSSNLSQAQKAITKGIVVVNGGIFQFGGNPNPEQRANISLFNPVTQQLEPIDSMWVNAVQDVLIEDHYAYVAASDSIFKFDLAQKTRVAANKFGVQTDFGGPGSTIKLASYDDYLLVGNWFGSSDNNLRIFDLDDLSFVDSIPELASGAKDMVVIGDTAYVTQNLTSSTFSDSAGFLAVVDLTTFDVVRNVQFPNYEGSIERLVAFDDEILALNTTSQTVGSYTVGDQNGSIAPSNTSMSLNSYGSQSFRQGDVVYFHTPSGVGAVNFSTGTLVDSNIVDTTIAAFTVDTLSGMIYASSINFGDQTTNKGLVYSTTGTKMGDFTVGFSPEALAVDYNYLPEAGDDMASVASNGNILIDVLDNDDDPDGIELDISILDMPTNGTAVVENDEIRYTPQTNFTGQDMFRYRLCDVYGDCDTAEVSVAVGSVGVGELVSNTHLQVYPNPAHHILNVGLTDLEPGAYDIRISDLSGKVVAESKEVSSLVISLNIEQLREGAYFIEANGENGRAVRKFIKH